MSESQAIEAVGRSGGDVRAAIARASQKTGIDFQYLLAQAKLESNFDPKVNARTSSAAGLYQFTRGTWLETLDRHGEAHGLSWAGDAISGGRVNNPDMAARIMALRYDADASALMAAELARDNGAHLKGILGRDPDAAELYLGHFMGAGGAGRFLKELASNPERNAAAMMPEAAAANRAIFYERGGAPRSVSGVMDLIRNKVSGAMESGGAAWAIHGGGAVDASRDIADGFFNAPVVREFQAARATAAAQPVSAALPVSGPQRSMADTLQSAFGAVSGEGQGSAPALVRTAYEKLARFGM